MLDFFEVVGILLKKGLLDLDLASSFWGYSVTRYWKALEGYVQEDRSRNPQANLWHECEDLVGQLGSAHYSDEEIARFLNEEMNLGSMAAAYQTLALKPPL